MGSEMFIPTTSNLSIAWAQAFVRVMQSGVRELSPLVVTVTDIDNEVPHESEEIRRILDGYLRRVGLQACDTVANTIFPQSLWNPHITNNADMLFTRFARAWIRIRRCPANYRGSYFHRLTAYCPRGVDQPINQLEHIINTYRAGNHRRSALVATIFDATRDHNHCRQLGFPCLHQVAFTPFGDRGLAVAGFYAMQYLLDRAYGNYLGLCRLGRFVAHQMGRRLQKVVCIASVAQRGTGTKSEHAPLARDLAGVLASMDMELQ